MNTAETKNAAIKSISAAMETEVGRKILTAKILSLSSEHERLRRKVAEDRIAVHALNELSIILLQMLSNSYRVFNDNHIPADNESLRLSKVLNAFKCENYTNEMVTRIERILDDTEGDDILLRDLIGNQPKEQ
jgi:hypothetical protein